MALLRLADDEQPFAMGAVGYVVSGESEAKQRITLEIQIEGLSTMAILDTGAPYSICDREITEGIGFDPAAAIEATTITTWGGKVKGHIHRATLSLPADEGESLFLDTPLFVPDFEDEQQEFAPGFPPSFIGLIGCLQSMRFAIDPSSETFYFMKSPL